MKYGFTPHLILFFLNKYFIFLNYGLKKTHLRDS